GPLHPVGYGGALLVPQSQPSLPSFLPLPQIVGVQAPGAGIVPFFGQAAPGSTWQVDEQPSPSVMLPSSHCSIPLIMLSPQAGTQGRPGTRHSKPPSTVLQSFEQPSPLAVLPSSHASVAPRMPSPQ